MSRTTEAEREAIRMAADSAGKLLPKLLQQRAHFESRIASLQAVVDAWKSLSAKPPRAAGVEAQTERSGSRVRRGQVPRHIDQILKDGGEYDEPELRKAIAEKFGADYGRATVYAALRRGRDQDHKYRQNGKKKWSWNPMNVAT